MPTNPYTSDVRVLNALDGQSISAIFPLGIAAQKGNFVRVDPASLTGQGSVFAFGTKFQLCSGTFGAMLERDVLNATSIPLDQIVFGNALLTPTLAGEPVSARFVNELEIEGPDLVETVDGSQGITVAPALETALTFLNGKFALISNAGTQVAVARVRGILVPLFPGNIRMYITMEKAR